MKARWGAACALLASTLLSAAPPGPVTIQADGRTPLPWRVLAPEEDVRFHLGHAVFNTTWLPAGEGGGRRDGLGPLFNSVSCDACHNSRRRGRGPVGDGPAPTDFVVQAGRRLPDGGLARGHPRFGHVVNTDATTGFAPEAAIRIDYSAHVRTRADGTPQRLWRPEYRIVPSDGLSLPDDFVPMPRMASPTLGAGLLETVPEAAVLALAQARRGKPRGRPSWVPTPQGRALGRFGWQATEPTVASQVATAFAREMGLTTAMVEAIDCGAHDQTCRDAAHGGTPEVAQDLFEAVVAFQRLEAVRRTPEAARRLQASADGARLFADTGCGDCHRASLPTGDGGTIAPYTDLLLHDLGPGLADRDLQGKPMPSRWRTAPLWGMSTAFEGGRPVRLLHDGRARGIDEAIGWHGGAAASARARYDLLDADRRQALIDWVSAL